MQSLWSRIAERVERCLAADVQVQVASEEKDVRKRIRMVIGPEMCREMQRYQSGVKEGSQEVRMDID